MMLMASMYNTSKYPDVDSELFNSVIKLSNDHENEGKISKKNNDTILKVPDLLHVEQLGPEDVSRLVDHCKSVNELSISYSLVNNEFLSALSMESELSLKTLRLEVHNDREFSQISKKTWLTFSNKLPNVNLVVLSYVSDEVKCDPLFESYFPVTHLYFGEAPSEATLLKIGRNCPRLEELVIAYYGSGLIDEVLISTAKGCPNLSAIGLGECELTCSGLIKFVTICTRRLQILYVWETSLIEDKEFDIAKTSEKISHHLGQSWVPEYIPLW